MILARHCRWLPWLFWSLGLVTPLQAAVFKCVDAEGRLSYSQSPCADAQRQEVVQPDRPHQRLAGDASNRYRSWDELTAGFACDDIAEGFSVLPTRSSLLTIMADIARRPGRASEWRDSAASAPDSRYVDGYLFRGQLCSLRLINEPGELSLTLGWYAAARELHASWPSQRLLSALRQLGYEPEATGRAEHWAQDFEGAGFGCQLRLHRSNTVAAVDLECRLGDTQPP